MSTWILTPEHGPSNSVSCWEEIETYLTQLDGEKLSTLTLKRKAKGQMIIGGGNFIGEERLYHVGYIYEVDDEVIEEEKEEGNDSVFDGNRYLHLIDPLKSDTREIWIKISQLSNLPENMCVNKEKMFEAVKYFYTHEKLNPNLSWIAPF